MRNKKMKGLQTLLSEEQIKEYPDGAYRWLKDNEYSKGPGTYYQRPPQAAPTFDSEIGAGVANTRWRQYKDIYRELRDGGLTKKEARRLAQLFERRNTSE